MYKGLNKLFRWRRNSDGARLAKIQVPVWVDVQIGAMALARFKLRHDATYFDGSALRWTMADLSEAVREYVYNDGDPMHLNWDESLYSVEAAKAIELDLRDKLSYGEKEKV